ncbi:3-oxo-tetronate kinase [Hypericibacter sp.]|uniref:3-oxo-tetronate kinase n=1 Tax=Hypericibacter sp. TaxID=2705401 RepID=UPI003D6CC342
MTVLLGCIADDLTGATDLANMLAREGMRTVQTIGIPARELALPPADAVVIALKSRTIPAEDAVRQSLVALDWLKRNGARQILFKYCSTFDSTDAGNIGPVADALLKALHARFTIACPAFPENGRSVFQGNLFVGNVSLADSGMRHHPLTPMTDSNLVRVLGRQTKAKVGLVPYNIVREGPAAIRKAFEQLQHDGMSHAIVDAIENQHLRDIGAASSDLALITGGSGIAIGLPANFRKENRLAPAGPPEKLERIEGLSAVLSGSCSQATLGQVAAWKARRPAFAIDPLALAQGRDLVADATAWAQSHMSREPVLIYASAPPEEVAKVQAALGREKAGALIEETLARIAQRLVAAGLRKLVIAGGETSGAIVQRLGVSVLRIGPQIDPGVPWTLSLGTPRLALALKSGNFGGPDFFIKALEMLT